MELQEKLEKRSGVMSPKDIISTGRKIDMYMKAIRDFKPVSSSYGLDENTRKAVNLILQQKYGAKRLDYESIKEKSDQIFTDGE